MAVSLADFLRDTVVKFSQDKNAPLSKDGWFYRMLAFPVAVPPAPRDWAFGGDYLFVPIEAPKSSYDVIEHSRSQMHREPYVQLSSGLIVHRNVAEMIGESGEKYRFPNRKILTVPLLNSQREAA